ncbi:Plasma membrane t-SNARE, secretory vesicle fusion [Monascus purpureus]|uniref:Plasma membrane t-SNARE, secretory vesicle fusion n=1 Tax=Monascus purpureus TaxID=5098 RepID=A0A507QML9_MONPU|nr:Plasma membrane t-SNARE, secretory vesicle fusion [Monascus purpureus]
MLNQNYKYQSLDENNQGGGYAEYNPYGNAGPYANQQTAYTGANAMEQGAGGYEMGSVNQPAGGQASILDQCKNISDAIQELRSKREGQLSAAQNALIDSSTDKEDQATRQTLDYIEDDINTGFRGLRDDIERLKKTPGSGDPRVQPQIDKAIRDLRNEIDQYKKAQANFQNRLKEQVRRRYEIANPDATPEELDQGVNQVLMGQVQTFQVTGTRTKQANDARQAALERSTAIRKIERDMLELSQLSEEIARLVEQQEVPVERIAEDAEQTKTHIQEANTHISRAIVSARKARKWKWIALIIVLIIIGVAVGVGVGVGKNSS